MESYQEQQDIEAALRRQAEPEHPAKSELAQAVGIAITNGAAKANIIFYRSPDGPDEPVRRLAA